MAEYNCPICKIQYEKNSRKAFLLECGHSACLPCIKFYKEAKRTLECGECCKMTQSLNYENKSLYKNSNSQNNYKAPVEQKDEFEVYIRKRNATNSQEEKFSVMVKKTMTVKELKDKIQRQQGIQSNAYTLAFIKPLTDESKTLEFYKITKVVTITMISDFEGGV
jgi:hypothetical protein